MSVCGGPYPPPSPFPFHQSQLPRHIASSMGNLLVSSLNILCVLICTYSFLLMDTLTCAVYTPECCTGAGPVVTGFQNQLKAAELMIGTGCSLYPTSQEGRPYSCLHFSVTSLSTARKDSAQGAVTKAIAAHPGEAPAILCRRFCKKAGLLAVSAGTQSNLGQPSARA